MFYSSVVRKFFFLLFGIILPATGLFDYFFALCSSRSCTGLSCLVWPVGSSLVGIITRVHKVLYFFTVRRTFCLSGCYFDHVCSFGFPQYLDLHGWPTVCVSVLNVFRFPLFDFFRVADFVVDPCSLAFVAFAVCPSLFSGFVASLGCLLFCFLAGRWFVWVAVHGLPFLASFSLAPVLCWYIFWFTTFM